MASATARMMEAFGAMPETRAAGTASAMHSPICQPPPAKASRLTYFKSLKENSKPSVNISSITPNSDIWAIPACVCPPPSSSSTPLFAISTPHRK